MFYESVVVSAIFYAVVCWSGSMKVVYTKWLNKLIRKAGCVVDEDLDCIETVTERRTLSRFQSIMDNVDHLLKSVVNELRFFLDTDCPAYGAPLNCTGNTSFTPTLDSTLNFTHLHNCLCNSLWASFFFFALCNTVQYYYSMCNITMEMWNTTTTLVQFIYSLIDI